ncbi:MAG: hypothetical protein KAU22_12000 [Desulfuromonadales bacterium]|nr:hypothetical protein [Desulfuromonadales bacterium]
MSNLQIDQLTPGMVLAEDIKSKNGRLLITHGMELTEKHLLILRTWGVQEVVIATGIDNAQGSSLQNPSEITAEQLEKAMEDLRPIFRLVDLTHPVFKELLRLAAQKKVLANG